MRFGFYPFHGKRRKQVFNKPDWSTVDWSKTNAELAKELGVVQNTVARNRLSLGALRCPNAHPDWSKVDWSLPNRVIAKRLGGLHPKTVSLYRKKFNAPPAPRGRVLEKWKKEYKVGAR